MHIIRREWPCGCKVDKKFVMGKQVDTIVHYCTPEGPCPVEDAPYKEDLVLFNAEGEEMLAIPLCPPLKED